MPITEKAKIEMLNVSQQHDKNNAIELERINELEKTYSLIKRYFGIYVIHFFIRY